MVNASRRGRQSPGPRMDKPHQETSSIPLPEEGDSAVATSSADSPVAPLAGLAVVSLVAGILSLMSALLLVPALCAIITGHLAIHKIRHTRRVIGGHRLALTGLILGYVSILMFSLLMVTGILLWPKYGPVLKEFFSERKTRIAMRHASELYLLCERYARDHNDRYPESWEDLKKGYSNDIDLGKWLASVHTDDPAYDPAMQLVRHERPVFQNVQHSVAVIQERAPPHVAEVVVVFADGHSETMPNPEHE